MKAKNMLWTAILFSLLAFSAYPLCPEVCAVSGNSSGSETGTVPAPESLKVLDLNTAIKIALSRNPSLAAASERVRQASERVRQTASGYWPSVDISVSGSRVWLSESANMPGAEDPEDYFRNSVTGTYLLFDGFSRRFSLAAARWAEKSSAESGEDARRLLISAVASAYYNAQLAKENVVIALADETFNRRQAGDARIRMEVGTGALSDVLNFEVLVNAARSDVIQSRWEYETARVALAGLMGIETSVFPEEMELAELKRETPEEMEIPDLDPQIEKALESRPDLKNLRFAVNGAESGVGQAKALYYPTVNFSVSVEGERTDDPGFDGDDYGASAGLYLSYSLFDGWYRKAKVREAKSAKSEAENQLKDAEIGVISDVRNALKSLRSARDLLTLQRENAKLVRQNRDLVEKEYQAGQTTLVRLNEAQKDLSQASSRLVQALVSLRQAGEELKAATGENLADFAGER